MARDISKLGYTDFKRFSDSLDYAVKLINNDAFIYCYSDVPEYVQALEQLKECIEQIKKREVE